ncbi:MAG: radical SAM family heme chaperone HemW [Haliscomenobacter sp.]|nr:radical SAM family heme chaperone HemW [Haliscomenobacter sp.]
MPGLYLHIPFCKQACHYCNFHFSTNLQRKGEMVEALLAELEIQRHYLQGAPLTSIYFGGGTPSLLSASELERLFEKIYSLHPVDSEAEITLEANPDDLSPDKLKALRDSPVNRLSIGIQSFSEADLRYMNRAHNAAEALSCIENALAAGFANLTADLIYGAPTTDDAQWAFNVQTMISLGIPHLSAYSLTVEDRTALAHMVQKGKTPPPDEDAAARQYEFLIDATESAGYAHYEISNFAREGWQARHNSSYWLGEPYLGIGPSAHSFDGVSRQWNIAHNAKYLQMLTTAKDGEALWYEIETLTPVQRYHDRLLTGLRTIWGVDPADFPSPFREHFLEKIRSFLQQGLVETYNGRYRLTRSGKFLADRITVDLFFG